VFPFKTTLPLGKYTMGYVEIETTSECPLFPAGMKARGHVHHASELLEEHHVGGVIAGMGEGSAALVGAPWRTGYVTHPQIPGAPTTPEGFTVGGVLASYVHLHFGGRPELATALVERCRLVDVLAVTDAVVASAVGAEFLEGSCAQATPPSVRKEFSYIITIILFLAIASPVGDNNRHETSPRFIFGVLGGFFFFDTIPGDGKAMMNMLRANAKSSFIPI